MARLITTQEEKDANSYLDWDDASLGRFAKHVALKYAEAAEDATGLHKVLAASCLMALVGITSEMNATEATFDLKGSTHKGWDIGDWKVTIKQTKQPVSTSLSGGER